MPGRGYASAVSMRGLAPIGARARSSCADRDYAAPMDVARHHSAERTPGARGVTFGRAQKERIALVMNVYRRLFAVSAGLTGDDLRRLGSQALDRRSEEHTSELQSQFHLVCRLLLEKKK